MAIQLKTPGVYITDTNAFPNSIVEVATAIPVFIGYTATASANGKSLLKTPARISSLAEYEKYFGGAFQSKFSLVPTTDKDASLYANGNLYNVSINNNNTAYLYNSMRLFFANGGGTCYILSVGTYADKPNGFTIDPADYLGSDTSQNVFDILLNESEITLVVIPDAIALGSVCYTSLYTPLLQHCAQLQSRMAILDVELVSSIADLDKTIATFREKMIANAGALMYGAAYCPWLNTSVVSPSEISFENLDASINLAALLQEDAAQKVLAQYNNGNPSSDKDKQAMQAALLAASPTYSRLMNIVLTTLNLLPPSGAIAGVMTTVDNTRGVWIAPANVSLNAVTGPAIQMTNDQQASLNIDAMSGESINAIRMFPNYGVLVWGARTLDGNSQDWRYINTRRTLIMIEQSIKLAIRPYIFSPNSADTWVVVKSVISNFLTSLWKQGALIGDTPASAFSVNVGLGSTMTADDILNGYMNVSVKLAITHPAEFIVLNFQQQMAGS